MTTTVAEAFKYAIANGFRTVNLSPTAEQSKARWRPRLVEYHNALVQRQTLRSRMVWGAYRVVMSHHASAQLLQSLLSRWRHSWD